MRGTLFLCAVVAFSITTVLPGVASEKLLYTFNGVPDGLSPSGGLVRDKAGNLYGATNQGGTSGLNGHPCAFPAAGCGTVFELTQTPKGKWEETVLYSFCPAALCLDGANPIGALVMGSEGNLYGATRLGGTSGAGVVFELARIGGTWQEIVLHSFCTAAVYCADGESPSSGLILDGDGNLYGTTANGGGGMAPSGAGVVFEISQKDSGWEETVLWPFCQIGGCPDGANPSGGVAFDSAGNLYGVAGGGTSFYQNCFTVASSCGVLFELSPAATAYWSYGVLYDFCPVAGCLEGEVPVGGITVDSLGNLYGTTGYGGTKGGGVIFAWTPESSYGVLYDFCSRKSSTHACTDGANPATTMIFDSAGNLYGTTRADGAGAGGVAFKLAPVLGGWKESVLYSFCKEVPCTDGSQPSALLVDQENLYGTTPYGGNQGSGFGVVFEISQ